MKALAVMLLLSSATCMACGDPRNEASPALSTRSDCGSLLRRISDIAPKADWESCVVQANYHPPAPTPSGPGAVLRGTAPPPPPPPPPMGNALGWIDPDYCRLIDPQARVDGCLVDEITDTQQRNEPFCPPMEGIIAVGDLAFLVLSDRHPALWEAMLGKGVDNRRYYQIIKTPKQRRRLQQRVRTFLGHPGPES